jgi:NAD(P)-dependent dehydrogenase (short-subunit alcohol dehydrogenase family)
MNSLTGQTVLITGAGAGIGRGLALAAAGRGAHVVVTSLSDNGRDTSSEIERSGGATTFVPCDVTDAGAVEAAVAAAVAATGRLDVVVHNALSRALADDTVRRLEDLSEAAWEHQVSVALRGAYYCARHAHRYLRDTRGMLLLLTSGAGIEGSPLTPAYASVKGAVRGMTKSLAREWGPLGIRVNCVSPLVRTPAFDRSVEDPEAKAFVLGLSALRYVGDVESDLAPAMMFLMSDDARYITGQTLVVDGGRCIQL